MSRSAYLFIDRDTGFERNDGDFEQFKNSVLAIAPDAEQEIAKIASKYEELNGDDYSDFICGKFLLTSLSCHLRKIIRYKFSNDDFRWFLINNFDISKLDYVKEVLLNS